MATVVLRSGCRKYIQRPMRCPRCKNPRVPVAPSRHPDHIAPMTKKPFRLTPYQVQFLIVVGFVTVGWALYVRYLAVEFSQVALACDAGLQTMICKARSVSTSLFKNSVFGIVALVIATLNLMRPSIVLLTL